MQRSSVHVVTFPDLPSAAAFIAATSRARLTLPADARLVLDATTPAMGLLEAERRLTP